MFCIINNCQKNEIIYDFQYVYEKVVTPIAETLNFGVQNLRMIRKIFGTAGARLIAALASFTILSLNARNLGPEGVGLISLLVVGLAILNNISSLIGGTALVYLVPRNNIFQLFSLSVIWSVFTSVAGGLILRWLQLIPTGYTPDIMVLSFLLSFININLMILLGKEKVKIYNLINILQSILTVSALYIWFVILKQANVITFVFVLYLSYSITLIISFLAITSYLKDRKTGGVKNLIGQFLKIGGSIQIAGLFQTLNYRFSYFLLKKFFGNATLGRFDVGVKFSEGLWLIGKSMALVQYSRISNESEDEVSRIITISFFKTSFVITLLAIIALLLVPGEVFTYFLGSGFSQVKLTIICLIPGILAIASGMIFSHYFSGTGKPHFNTIGSGIGLVAIISAGYLLIPRYGLAGAGIATSFSYMISLIFQLVLFVYQTKTPFSEFMINQNDMMQLKNFVIPQKKKTNLS